MTQSSISLGRVEKLSESVLLRHAGALEAAPVVPADGEGVKFTFFVAGDLDKQQRESRCYW